MTPEVDMRGWRFVFAVDIGQLGIEKGTTEERDLKTIMDQAGDYSIYRLYLDFNSKYLARLHLQAGHHSKSLNSEQDRKLQVCSFPTFNAFKANRR